MSQAGNGDQDEGTIKEQVRQARIDQYRDWLIPGTIFSSIATSIFILEITSGKLGGLVLAVAISSFISISFYIISLFYSFTRLEDITIFREKAPDYPALLFVSGAGGTLSLVISLVCLSFQKSTLVGICIAGLSMLFLIGFVLMLRHIDVGVPKSESSGYVHVLRRRTLQGMARVRSGQAPPGPWFPSGVFAEAPGSSMTSCVRAPGRLTCTLCPAARVMLEAGGADTYTQRAIPGSEPSLDFCTFRTPNPTSLAHTAPIILCLPQHRS